MYVGHPQCFGNSQVTSTIRRVCIRSAYYLNHRVTAYQNCLFSSKVPYYILAEKLGRCYLMLLILQVFFSENDTG